ncbi:ABC transporter permease [Chloroflexota bacterium]
MRNFLLQAYYGYRGLYIWLPWPSYVTLVILGPMLTMMMFTLVGRFALGPAVVRPYLLGMVAQYIPFIVSAGIVNCFAHERFFGTLSIVYASRANRAEVFFSRLLLHIPNGFVVVAAGLFFSWLLLGVDFSMVNWPVFLLSVLIISLSSSGAGGFISNFTIVMADWIMLYRIFTGIIIVLTGVIIPLSSLPAPLAAFSQVLPLTHGLVAFRAAFDGAVLIDVWPFLIKELIVGLVYMTLGYTGYNVAEIVAKRQGILETMV